MCGFKAYMLFGWHSWVRWYVCMQAFIDIAKAFLKVDVPIYTSSINVQEFHLGDSVRNGNRNTI